MGGNGVHSGINDHDPYCGQALRSVRAQVVLDRWNYNLSAGLCTFWHLADDEPVFCVTIFNQVTQNFRRSKEEAMSERMTPMSRKDDTIESHTSDGKTDLFVVSV